MKAEFNNYEITHQLGSTLGFPKELNEVLLQFFFLQFHLIVVTIFLKTCVKDHAQQQLAFLHMSNALLVTAVHVKMKL